jgi:hypothetical protein
MVHRKARPAVGGPLCWDWYNRFVNAHVPVNVLCLSLCVRRSTLLHEQVWCNIAYYKNRTSIQLIDTTVCSLCGVHTVSAYGAGHVCVCPVCGGGGLHQKPSAEFSSVIGSVGPRPFGLVYMKLDCTWVAFLNGSLCLWLVRFCWDLRLM